MAGGHAWQGACVVGGMHGRGHAWQGACVAGGMRGNGRACVVGEVATATDCTHPTGMHSCCVNSFSVLPI